MNVINDKNLLSYLSDNDLKLIDSLLKQCKFNEISYTIQKDYVDKYEDHLNKQILLTIYIFALLKIQKYEQVKEIFDFYRFEKNIFPYKFLEGKYYFLINDYQSALIIFNNLKLLYESDNKEIIALEEESQFVFFEKFFQNFFCLNNKNNKIKKCYFEIKNCFSKLGMLCEVYNTIEKCYSKYSDDIVVKYEMLKCCVMTSNFIKTEEIFNSLKELYNKTDNNSIMITIYENYLNFSEAIMWISKCEYEIAKNKLSEILRNNPDNIIIMNNISSLNLYLNKIDRCFTDLRLILDKDQMNSYNETTYHNINTLSDLFNIKLI